jgi:hypothetical protein
MCDRLPQSAAYSQGRRATTPHPSPFVLERSDGEWRIHTERIDLTR